MQRATSGKNKISTSRTNMNQYQNLTSPRKKISQQSIQQFKIQIDHQIAKCLDTLDRQGLKFLRQTLKTSNLFNSANLQIEEESIKYEKKELEYKVKSYAEKAQFQTLKSDNANYSHSKKPNAKDDKNKVQRSSSRNRIQSKKYNSNNSFRVNQLERVQKVENTANRKKQIEKSSQQQIKDTKNRQQIKASHKIEEFTKNKKNESVKRLPVQQKQQKDIKVRPNSKASTKIIIQNKKTHEKISLGEKINKKMEQLHISKVGPARNDKNKTSKKPELTNKNTKLNQKVQQPEEMIEEDIIQGADQQIQNENQSNLRDLEVNNPSTLIEESINDVSMEQQSVKKQPQQQVSVKISQKSNPLRPFKKDKLQSISYLNRQEDQGIFIQSQTQKKKPKQVQKLSYSIQVNESKFQRGQLENQVQKNNSAQMSMIVEKINKLSPNKLLQIQKYLEYIEKADKNQINQSQIQQEKQTHQQQFEQFTQQRISSNQASAPGQTPKNSQVMDEIEQTTRKSKIPFLIYQNDSSKKLNKQRKQKASLIYNANLKSASRSRIKIDADLEDNKGKELSNKSVYNYNSSTVNNSPILPLNNNSRYQSQVPKTSQTIILNEQKPLKMEKIDFSENKQSESSISKNSPSKNLLQSNDKFPQIKKKPSGQVQQKQQEIIQNESIVNSSNLNIQYTEVKMLNLNVKKSQIRNKIQPKTILKFKILSNRGHSSLFGLTGIQLFTIQGKRVIVSEKDLEPNITSKAKILNLFNGHHLTTQQESVYQSSMAKNQITVSLDKQNEKIGGIVIFNFNKSFLESNKEVDEMQIYHNDDKVWKGTLKHGSYDQFTNYGTYVQFMPEFKFPEIKKSSFEQDKIQVRKQEKTSLWIQNTQQNSISIMKQSEITKNNSFKTFSRNQTKPQQAQNNEKSTSDLRISQPKKSPSKQQHFSQFRNQENSVNYRTEQNKKIDTQKKFSEIRNSDRIPQNQIQTNHFASKNTSRNQKNDYDEFDTMLKGLEQNIDREKSKSKITPVTVFEQSSKQEFELRSNYQNKYQQQKSLERNFSKNQVLDGKQTKDDRKGQIDDFINDSLFHQKPQYSRIPSERRKLQAPKQQKIQEVTFEKKKEPIKQRQQRKQDINIDDFLGQLQNVMGNKMTIVNKKIKAEKSFAIPNLPQGSIVQLQIFQNWGHQALVGIQGIQFFDQQGNNILPNSINCNKNLQNIDLLKTLNANNIRNRDQKMLTKVGYDKGNSTIFTFSFSPNRIFSLIRIWNYNGHRVHSNIGIKYCLLKINQSKIFMGELRKNQSTPQNFHKQFQTILLTNDLKIISKIKDKDWLTQLKNKLKQQKQLFKSTLMNFNRPKTRNTNEGTPMKRKQEEIPKMLTKQIKLPKRVCWEYEPPQFPQGKVLVFLLHDTWGDKNFIGLNGIQIFNNSGNLITKDKISKIKAFPSSTGQNNQKRIVQNLINGFNYTTLDTNIWLSTYQSDLEKLQTGKPNTVILQLHKSTKLSGINIYNYSKTPERGVREIQIQIDSMIAFRGYVKMYDQSNAENSVHTTINFTKDLDLLTKMNYEGYNQDSIDQNVNHVNEKKVVRI